MIYALKLNVHGSNALFVLSFEITEIAMCGEVKEFVPRRDPLTLPLYCSQYGVLHYTQSRSTFAHRNWPSTKPVSAGVRYEIGLHQEVKFMFDHKKKADKENRSN